MLLCLYITKVAAPSTIGQHAFPLSLSILLLHDPVSSDELEPTILMGSQVGRVGVSVLSSPET